jgi:hypothetical protein
MLQSDPIISAAFRSSRDAGSCNACARHNTATGITDHRVLEVHLQGLSFRLCDICFAALHAKLDNIMELEMIRHPAA